MNLVVVNSDCECTDGKHDGRGHDHLLKVGAQEFLRVGDESLELVGLFEFLAGDFMSTRGCHETGTSGAPSNLLGNGYACAEAGCGRVHILYLKSSGDIR